MDLQEGLWHAASKQRAARQVSSPGSANATQAVVAAAGTFAKRQLGLEASDQEDKVEHDVPGVGGWGGSCTCPSGAVYLVGDNNDYCGSLACVDGEPGECISETGAGAGTGAGT